MLISYSIVTGGQAAALSFPGSSEAEKPGFWGVALRPYCTRFLAHRHRAEPETTREER